MSKSQLIEFLDGAGEKPYRQLVEYHIKRTPTKKLQQAVLGESTIVPEKLKPMMMSYIDTVNEQLGYNSSFWAQATCHQAFEEIIKIAITILQPDINIDSVEGALKPKNHELSFQLFQIPTLSFAYSASTQRKQREFMGIRKGLFG
jgi:hypothetical protein